MNIIDNFFGYEFFSRYFQSFEDLFFRYSDIFRRSEDAAVLTKHLLSIIKFSKFEVFKMMIFSIETEKINSKHIYFISLKI